MIQPRTITTTAIAVLLVASLVGAVAAPAAATHDDSTDEGGLSDALSPTDNGSLTDTIRGTASGLFARASYAVSSIRGDSPAAEDSKQEALEEFNANSANYVEYLNNRDVHNGEVVEVTFSQNDDTATMYIVGELNETSGEYESAEAVNSTDRAVDHDIELQGMAADNAADELERFNDEFASTGDDITSRYISEMATKYGGNVDEPFTGDA